MTASDLIAVGLMLVAALVWAVIARHLWSYRSVARERHMTFRITPLFATVMAFNNFVHVAWVLLDVDFLNGPAFLVVPHDISNLAIFALARHMLRLLPLPEDRPGRRWVALNYGPAAVVSVVYSVAYLLPGTSPAAREAATVLYDVCFAGLVVPLLLEVVRVARPGPWGPESAGELRRTDLMLMGGGVAAAGVAFAVFAALGRRPLALELSEAGLSLAIAAPFALRLLGALLPELVVSGVMLAATGAALWGYTAGMALLEPRFRPLLALAAVTGLGLVLAAGQASLRAWATKLVLGRGDRQQGELLAFLHMLAPELGVVESSRRALGELVRVRQLRGAAIILHDGEAIVTGRFNLAPLARVWPTGDAADALPARIFGSAELRELPPALREALLEANVGLGAAPIIGARRRWGHLFMNTGLLGGTFHPDDFAALEAFVGQLALLLDGADLLVRTVAVERSLAHAEKLAAIGELAARIAHELRNPVTAARSLAQQLASETAPPLDETARLILTELERVERQVAALLRFARRDEFRFAAVDVGALVRETVEASRARLDADGIAVVLDLAEGIEARADRERVRQVLVNLIDNAADALANGAPTRRITLTVARANGHASLSVVDSGPGVPLEALPHLFEPFFSLKAHGTGLGLAIAKRTVDAHGGRIAVRAAPGGGAAFDVELPLA
jgi:signal transduction histidine kinase